MDASNELVHSEIPPLQLIVPCYKNAYLIKPLVNGILNCADEIRGRGNIIFIIDSPHDKELIKELDQGLGKLKSSGLLCSALINKENIGFIRSVNVGLEIAIQNKHNVLLLNSDAVLYHGCVEELRYVAYSDPMITFVSPRSNNAGITSLPVLSGSESLACEQKEAYSAYLNLRSWLPRWQFSPTAVGFCLYIKHDILAEIGVLDEIYGHGYNEENDLVMRANRYGYRAALANYAYCSHIGSASFGKKEYVVRDAENRKILDARYPEFSRVASAYFDSSLFKTEQIISGLLLGLNDGRIHVAIDFTNIGPNFNGTTELALKTVNAIHKNHPKWVLHFLTDNKTAAFHGLGNIGYIESPISSKKYSCMLHMGQPFAWETVCRSAFSAPINLYFMLDTIAQDCGYLFNEDVDNIWRFVSQHADGIIYISNYARELFHKRYTVGPTVKELTCLLSTASEEYAKELPNSEDHILVIGNHFFHKAIPETVQILALAFPFHQIVVIGTEQGQNFSNVTYIKSGEVPDSLMESYYAKARFIVFPSHYEGFGFPMVKAVAYKKRVIVRKSSLVLEILPYLPNPELVQMFTQTVEIPGLIKFDSHIHPVLRKTPRTWDMVAEDLVNFMQEILNFPDDGRRIRSRLDSIRLLMGREKEREAMLELNKVHASRSWRYTKPLRKASTLARIFLKR